MPAFESDVISDGTQTLCEPRNSGRWFESDVISDGTQTHRGLFEAKASLRVM